MDVEIKVPDLPESVQDAVVLNWSKGEGDAVHLDEVLVELETDKVVLEVPASIAGSVARIVTPTGSTVTSGMVLCELYADDKGADSSRKESERLSPPESSAAAAMPKTSPAVRHLLATQQLSPAQIVPAQPHRITKGDVLRTLAQRDSAAEAKVAVAAQPSVTVPSAETVTGDDEPLTQRVQRRVPMTRLRSRIADRLLAASQSTAMLTTFNEVNMQPLQQLRARYRERFEQVHAVRLSFMSFFVRASVEALKRFPTINACIDGQDILYHSYMDIGVAVSTERGLVVPVLRDAHMMSQAAVEKQIADYASQARGGKIAMEDLIGGTFTVSNGGVFGSLLSTPILNPPQSAILGMHTIQQRPIALEGEVHIRPMMYLALSYDHRIVDGREAVQFLRTIKEYIEDPAAMLLNV